MIPQCVRLRGFLCYKDEQTVDFSGSPTLWMLSGVNGSGKSAIFDAVTFALFGHHRGGSGSAVELINKDSDGLAVEFDFGLDGTAYRARRTQKRDNRGGARGTQQLLQYDAAAGTWNALEGTNYASEFKDWVRDHIGLDYETFTSSVLLLQGQAEKLLDSSPEGRRKVLAGVVDLQRYEGLYRRADEVRKNREGEWKALNNRLANLPPVEPIELAEVEGRIAEAEEQREAGRVEVERLQKLEHLATGWFELQGRLNQARERVLAAQRLLDDAPQIEAAVDRLRELRTVLPHLKIILDQRSTQAQAARLLEEHKRTRLKQQGVLTQKDDALNQTRQKRDAVRTRLDEDQARLQQVSTDFRHSAERLARLREFESQEAERTRIREELQRLPADPAGAVSEARKAQEHLAGLGRVVPLLLRFRGLRDDLGSALEHEKAAETAQVALRSRGEKLNGETEALRPRLADAVKVREETADQVAETRTLLQQAKESLRELTLVSGSKVCRHCGQDLSEGHLHDEQRRRTAAAAEAEQRARQAAEAHKAARAAEQRLREQFDSVEKQLIEAREEFKVGKLRVTQARQEVERLQRDCAKVYGDLPEPFARRVSPTLPDDWLSTTYPSADECAEMRTQANNYPAAQATLDKAEKVLQQWQRLQTREGICTQALERLQGELPADRAGVRKEHDRLEADERVLRQSLETKKVELRTYETDLERLDRERSEAQKRLIEIEGLINKQDLTQQNAEQAIKAARQQLPRSWQGQVDQVGTELIFRLTNEQTELVAKGTEARAQDLLDARLKLDHHRRDQVRLETEQEAFPPEARQGPGPVRLALEDARRGQRQRDDAVIQARQQHADLESRRRQRQQVEQESVVAQRELATEELLAKLLGKDRLQLYLVRQAERQVVEYANSVLDRLSGGQLCLRLVGEAGGDGATAKALELEAYNRVTGEKPINVAFLSGSQKFRVAVSLALGIGQYASRQHRPIESVIIDEGFGCLDRQGRQVMIQELQNLRGQLRCILLVSHQEEFADAFSDGYHFELEGGATKVTRVQK